MNLYFNADSETNNIYSKCNVGLCRPPLGDFRYWSLDVLSTDTISLLVALAFGLSSSDLSSSHLTSSGGAGTGLPSSEGIGTGLTSSEGTGTLDRLGIWFGQSLHICWFGLS